MTQASAVYLLGPLVVAALISKPDLFRAAVVRAWERGDAWKLEQLRAVRELIGNDARSRKGEQSDARGRRK